MSYIKTGQVSEFEEAVKNVLKVRSELLMSVSYAKILELPEDEITEFVKVVESGSGKHLRRLNDFHSMSEAEKLEQIQNIASNPRSVDLPPVRLETLYRLSDLEKSRILELQKEIRNCTDKMVETLDLKRLANRGQSLYRDSDNVQFTQTNVFYAIFDMIQKLGKFDGAIAYLDSWMKAEANRELENSVEIVDVEYSTEDTERRKVSAKLKIATSLNNTISDDDDSTLLDRCGNLDKDMSRHEEAESSVLLMMSVHESFWMKFMEPPATRKNKVVDLEAYREKQLSKLSDKAQEALKSAYVELKNTETVEASVVDITRGLFEELENLAAKSVAALQVHDYDTVQLCFEATLEVTRKISPILLPKDRIDTSISAMQSIDSAYLENDITETEKETKNLAKQERLQGWNGFEKEEKEQYQEEWKQLKEVRESSRKLSRVA